MLNKFQLRIGKMQNMRTGNAAVAALGPLMGIWLWAKMLMRLQHLDAFAVCGLVVLACLNGLGLYRIYRMDKAVTVDGESTRLARNAAIVAYSTGCSLLSLAMLFMFYMLQLHTRHV